MGRGECVNGVCACRAGFGGERCDSINIQCPGDCSGHGTCDTSRGCVCALGYAGEDCGRSACADATDDHHKGCHGRGHCTCERATRQCSCQCHVGFAPPFCANTTCPADCHSRLGQGHCDRGRCRCAPGFRGMSCATEICPKRCSPPNGRCLNGDCICTVGWKGRACDVSTCPGEPVACSGHGHCTVNHLNEVRCGCDTGFKGLDCAVPLNSTAGRRECASRLCGGERRGHCSSDDSGPCICNAGWTGDDCTQLLCPDSCSGQGLCTDLGCQCYDGYMGQDCATPNCPNQCSGRGSCDAGICRCDAGWADNDCSLPSRPHRASTTDLWLPSASARSAPDEVASSVEEQQ